MKMAKCLRCGKERKKNPCEHCGAYGGFLAASGDDGTGKPKETHTAS